MGKKRAVGIKRIAEILTTRNPNAFSSDFEDNKRLITEMMWISSKTMRNRIAGYITQQVNKTALEMGLSEDEKDEEDLAI